MAKVLSELLMFTEIKSEMEEPCMEEYKST